LIVRNSKIDITTRAAHLGWMYHKPKQRGLTGVAYLVLAIVLIGALAGLVAAWKSYTGWIDKAGFDRGVAQTDAKWETQELAAADEARKQRAGLQLKVDQEVGKRQAAEAKAGAHYVNWQREKENAKKQGLTGGCKPAADGKPADMRFTWVFVDAYSRAYTDKDGKPLYPDSVRPAETAATADSPVGAGDVLDIHGLNAERHSACIRDYNALIDVVLKLKTDWDLQSAASPARP
jgi:hypothetical protein